MDETPDNPHYSKEDGAAKFQPAGLGSFHSTRQTIVENAPQQDLVSHPVMLAELTRMCEALVLKIVMENGAILTALRVDNQNFKNDVDQLRQEVRSTYLDQKAPEGIQSNNRVPTTTEETNRDTPKTQPRNANSGIPDSPPSRPTMASMAAKNAPTTIKLADWTTVANKKGQKNNDKKNSMPPPLKSVEEAKRRMFFLRSSDVPAASKKIAKDILHAMNIKILSMRLPAQLRLIKLGYNERGNLTGLTSAQTVKVTKLV